MQDTNTPIWNPFQKGYKENPYQHLHILREQNPVHQAINGRWILLKYKDVKFLFTDPIFKTVKISQAIGLKSTHLHGSGNFKTLSEISAKWMLFFEPPQHTELRSMTARIWNEYEATEIVKETVAENIEFLSKKQEADIIGDFATHIPTKVICKILGLPPQEYFKMRDWSYAFNTMFEPFSTLHDFKLYDQKAKDFCDYFSSVIKAKRQKPDEAFISRFLDSNEKLAEPLNDSEIISVLAFLFFAGIESSINLFGASIMLLIKNPSQAELLRSDDSIAPRAVDELLRYITPIQYTARILSEDMEFRGQKIKAGEFVMGATVSANHDEEVFENPENLDFTRPKNPHLGFGMGLHYCMGARLARLEAVHSFPGLIKRFPNIKLDPKKNFVWDKMIFNRGLKSLPVILN